MPANSRSTVRRLGKWLTVLVAGCGFSILLAGVCSAEELEERRARVAAMTPAEKQQLLRKQERFAALPAEEQQQLRQLQEQLENDPRGDRLRDILSRYYEWLKTLSPGQRAELLELPPDQRIELIKKLKQEQAKRAAREEGERPLSSEDFAKLARWVDEYALLHERELIAGLDDRWKQRIQEQDAVKRKGSLVWALIGRSIEKGEMPFLTEIDIESLSQKLSPEAQDRLNLARETEQEKWLIGHWARMAMHDRFERMRSGGRHRQMPGVAQEDLERFFQQMSTAERDELLKLQPEEMQRQLRRKYFRQGQRHRPGFDPRGKGPGRDEGGRPFGPPGEAFRPPGPRDDNTTSAEPHVAPRRAERGADHHGPDGEHRGPSDESRRPESADKDKL